MLDPPSPHVDTIFSGFRTGVTRLIAPKLLPGLHLTQVVELTLLSISCMPAWVGQEGTDSHSRLLG